MNHRLLPALTALLLAGPLSAGGIFEVAVGTGSLRVPGPPCPDAKFMGDFPVGMPAEFRDRDLDGMHLSASYIPRPNRKLELAITAACHLPGSGPMDGVIQTRSDGTTLTVGRYVWASYVSLGVAATHYFTRRYDVSIEVDLHRDQVEFAPRTNAPSFRESRIRAWFGGSATWRIPLDWKARPFLRFGGGMAIGGDATPSLTGTTEEVSRQMVHVMVPNSDLYLLMGFRFGK